jgi:hypothetical protein
MDTQSCCAVFRILVTTKVSPAEHESGFRKIIGDLPLQMFRRAKVRESIMHHAGGHAYQTFAGTGGGTHHSYFPV